MNPNRAEALVEFFQTMTVASLDELGDYYADDCRFKDPFNEVRGLDGVRGIFRQMFLHLEQPRFMVTERYVGENSVTLYWTFEFRVRRWRPNETHRIHGVSRLALDASGKVVDHRDYWDAAGELYEKLPVVGAIMRLLKRCLR